MKTSTGTLNKALNNMYCNDSYKIAITRLMQVDNETDWDSIMSTNSLIEEIKHNIKLKISEGYTKDCDIVIIYKNVLNDLMMG